MMRSISGGDDTVLFLSLKQLLDLVPQLAGGFGGGVLIVGATARRHDRPRGSHQEGLVSPLPHGRGDLAGAVAAAAGEGRDQPFLVAASRSLMSASNGPDHQHAAAEAARQLRDQIQQLLKT